MDARRTVRAAAVQLAPVIFDRDGSTQKVLDALWDAQRQVVDFLVFPETFIPNNPYFSTWLPPPSATNTFASSSNRWTCRAP